MRFIKLGSWLLVGAGLVVLLAAPIGPLPGVFIGGTPTEPPRVWQDTSGVDEIQLKVPGRIPRVVIIWVIAYAGELHVLGMRDGGWTGMIGEGSDVEVRIGDRTYALRATPVNERVTPILEAYKAKYEPNYPDLVAQLPSIDEASDVAVVFRLERP